MAESVNIEISGEIPNASTEKIGLQKLLQYARSGAVPALMMRVLNKRQPWTQFIATENFKVPTSVPRISRRFYKNLQHFQANYLIIFLGLFIYCLITSPFLLFAVVVSSYCIKKYFNGHKSFKIGGWELPKIHQVALVSVVLTILFVLADAQAVLFWILGTTVTIVGFHAIFYDADALPSIEDPEKFPMIEEV
ncbi:prenylated Rab acceptor protein 1 isoform X2 [Pararge aegeria]|uniref:PRA1 family protein n=1 Tax=Pararge aegeria aegeria TaxID=348720 RepID=A0A8S4SID6_9NEOP|nr:prenylated Rab acceptor protein 1 isoform X2 [Pararge aegeria]CAH2268771.1 jg23792 [Pararge aegeria aegeria]